MSRENVAWLLIGAALISVLALTACSSVEEQARVEQPGDGDLSLSELISRLKGAEYRVTYDSSAADGSRGQLIVAVKGDKTFVAIDFEGGELAGGSFAGTGLSGIEIEDGSTSYSCGDLADLFGLFGGGSGGGEVCYRSESTQDEDDLPSLRDMFNPAGWGMAFAGAPAEPDGSESIAGREARCFKVDSVDIGRGRACVDQDLGVLLLFEGTDSDGASISSRAIELSDEVDDSVFDPPYEVKEYPDLPLSD